MKALIAVLALMLGSPAVVHAAHGDARLRLDRFTAVADSLYASGQPDSAAAVGRRAVEAARQSGDRAAQIAAYASLGVYLRSGGHTADALRSYEQGLNLATGAQLADSATAENVATLYVNLATLYLDEGQHGQALTYARKVAGMDDRLKSEAFRRQLYPVVASIFLLNHLDTEAEVYLRRSLELARRDGATDEELMTLCYYLPLLQRQGRTAELRRVEARAAALARRTTAFMPLVNYCQTAASVALAEKDYRRAARHIDAMLRLDGIEAYGYVVYDAYNNLHLCYSHMGDYRRAYETLQQAATLRDSLFVAEKSDAMEEMAAKYDVREKELKLKESEAKRAEEKAVASRRLTALAGAAAVLLLGAGLLVQRQRIRAERQRRRAETREREYADLVRLSDARLRRSYLAGLENERERLSRELHDGVANDLLAIEMDLRQTPGCDGKTLRRLGEARQSVRDISHGLLPPAFREATLDDVLWDYLGQADERATAKVAYRCLTPEAPWERLPQTAALSVYRIVQEAVGNSLKHASASRIDVSLGLSPDGRLTLDVTDDGRSIPSRPRRLTAGQDTMRRRAADLGGQLHVENGSGGMRVHLDARVELSPPA